MNSCFIIPLATAFLAVQGAANASIGPIIRVRTIGANRSGLPLPEISAFLDRQLKALGSSLDLTELPPLFILELCVSSFGTVLSSGLDRACGKAGTQIEQASLSWQFQAWPLRGNTYLKVPVEVVS
jgi:hypothetical protein